MKSTSKTQTQPSLNVQNTSWAQFCFQIQFFPKGDYTVALTENNLCYVWGYNYFGQLGLGDNNDRSIPTLLTLPKNERIYFINCGASHTICLTENNLCYVWGSNEYGQLGLGDKNHCYAPTLLTFPNNERISFITCGAHHTICLTENNLCYVWGLNNCGQLGLGDKNDRLIPTLFSLPNNERISFITCGSDHTICLTENNLCYVWGWNYYGQLGLGDTNNLYAPTLLTLPNSERISFITCGDSHTICLTENNLCYVWGRNTYDKLGLGDNNDRSIPTLFSLPNNERISFITCGDNHTICLTENNLCYVWGRNTYGQLGLGDTNDRSTPTLLTLPNNERISFITCGSDHTICLTENNLCYVWGRNTYGQLGMKTLKVLLPEVLPFFIKRNNSFFFKLHRFFR